MAQGNRSPLSASVGNNLRISSVTLQCAVSISEMESFYRDKMGFSVINADDLSISFQMGKSILIFEKVTVGEGGETPFYHFAFNIPENKLLSARTWLQNRTTLLVSPPHLRDAKFSEDVWHFSNWNAHSLYFWDPADNIVEFIARHELQNATEGDFTTSDILCMSEIGYMVDEPAKYAQWLNEKTGLSAYPAGTDNWWAMGDAAGLVLCLPTGRHFGDFLSGKSKSYTVFPTKAEINGEGMEELVFENYPYQLKVNDK